MNALVDEFTGRLETIKAWRHHLHKHPEPTPSRSRGERSALQSDIAGVAHLGAHHGHTAMLLAAGEYLARTRNFNGTVRLIFHPAEEIMAGGPR